MRYVPYNPNYAVHPREFVKEAVEYYSHIEIPSELEKEYNDLMHSDGKITDTLAEFFSKSFEGSKEYWLRLQHYYDEGLKGLVAI